MASELTSTARPTRLRLAGFACVALGAVLAGVGATREWVAVGLKADIEHVVDSSTPGTDVWEGKVIVFIVAIALVVTLAMRISASATTRRALAIVLIMLGVACVVLPLTDAVRSRERFGGAEGLERYVAAIAAQAKLPEEVVRKQLEGEFNRASRVEIGPGLWLTVFGGTLLVAGGVLSLIWVRREGRGVSRPPEIA